MSCLRRIFRSGGGSFTPSPTPAPSPTPTPTPSGYAAPLTYLPLGVWAQNPTRIAFAGGAAGAETWPAIPADSDVFGTWKARGINTLVGCDGQTPPGSHTDGSSWDYLAEAKGLRVIRKPIFTFSGRTSADAALDLNNPNLVCVAVTDELDGSVTEDGQALIDAVQAEITPMSTAGYLAVKPVMVNWTGENVAFYFGTAHDSNGVLGFPGAAAIPGLTYGSSDWYPEQSSPFIKLFAQGNSQSQDCTTTHQGRELDTLLRGYMNTRGVRVSHGLVGKQAFMHINMGRFDTFHSSTTYETSPSMFRLQFWSGIINGAAGIFVFPQGISYSGGPGPGVFTYSYADATNTNQANLRAELTACAANLKLITHLQPEDAAPAYEVLIDTVNGGRRPYTLRRCQDTAAFGTTNPNDANPILGTIPTNGLPFPFEGVDIPCGGETFRIVLNLADSNYNGGTPPTLSLTSDPLWGTVNMGSFSPHQVKCFKASAPTVNIFS